ncbi:hypothetical protein TNCT_401011 [Trichonephila clavata]|uniref:Uncharacterized protein n=1 Tax=Trichonephila clavata TaxID=2740835 RepID=A0A8X6HNY5_TRICU|nr:hypothetical protein TNCT_401011 [Trichonephila clavata]
MLEVQYLKCDFSQQPNGYDHEFKAVFCQEKVRVPVPLRIALSSHGTARGKIPDPDNPTLGNFHGFRSYSWCLACFCLSNNSPDF